MSNPNLASYMWKCVNSVTGCDKSQWAEFPWGIHISLDIIDFFQSVGQYSTSSY